MLVILPKESTVVEAYVYVPAETVVVAKLHVNWLELEASLKLESVRKRKEGPFTELMVVVTPCFPLKVSQSAEDKNPFVEADDVAIVKVRVFEEVEIERFEAPEVAKVKDAV